MDLPVGRIVSVADGRATVSVDRAFGCARCAAGRGCGAGLLAVQSRLIDVRLVAGLALRPGDEVRLALAPSSLLRAALLAYGLPLAGLVTALGIAWYLKQSLADRPAVALAAVGLVAGLLVGRHFLNRDGCLRNLVPTISERLR